MCEEEVLYCSMLAIGLQQEDREAYTRCPRTAVDHDSCQYALLAPCCSICFGDIGGVWVVEFESFTLL